MVFGRNVSNVDVFQSRIASKVNNTAHVGNVISTDINNGAMSITKACSEMYAKLNLLIIPVTSRVRQTQQKTNQRCDNRIYVFKTQETGKTTLI